MAFHEIQFPTTISRGSSGGPKRLTDIVTLRSGAEERNTIWADSRRQYNAGLGIRSMANLYEAIKFFEARRGRLHGFRWKDWSDYKSVGPTETVSDTDVSIGTGDGSETDFQLIKIYSDLAGSYTRTITKPVSGSVVVALDGTPQTITTDFTVDTTTGIVTFVSPPGGSVDVTAGFEFDVPVRFDHDTLDVNVDLFDAGHIPQIDVVEIKI